MYKQTRSSVRLRPLHSRDELAAIAVTEPTAAAGGAGAGAVEGAVDAADAPAVRFEKECGATR